MGRERIDGRMNRDVGLDSVKYGRLGSGGQCWAHSHYSVCVDVGGGGVYRKGETGLEAEVTNGLIEAKALWKALSLQIRQISD